MVRGHLDEIAPAAWAPPPDPQAPAGGLSDTLLDICDALSEEKWRSECYFSLSESFARAGDRGAALLCCGRAGAYYDECLYHAWTFELQAAADRHARAVDGIEAARPIVRYWAQIETIAGDPEVLLWNDWWYFAHTRNKPARLSDCPVLGDALDRQRCEDGTRLYVTRTVTETLFRPSTARDTRERICRGDDVTVLFPEAWERDPVLDAAALEGKARGCAEGKIERPWNPIFRARQ